MLLGDGAHWNWEQGPEHVQIPGKSWTEILDFFHASEHLANVAHALYPDDLTGATQWLGWAAHRLKQEGRPGPIKVWITRAPTSPPSAIKGVAREGQYFAFHADRIDYPAYATRGLPIGSGMVENACKALAKTGESGRGMRVAGAGRPGDRDLARDPSLGALGPLLAGSADGPTGEDQTTDGCGITIMRCTRGHQPGFLTPFSSL